MENAESRHNWSIRAAKALKDLEAIGDTLDALGCDVAAAYLSQAIDALQNEIHKDAESLT